jgi:hypothetical protein
MIKSANLLLLFLAMLVSLSAQTAKPLVSPNKNIAVKNSQSIRHFLKDLKNIAGGFMTNRSPEGPD